MRVIMVIGVVALASFCQASHATVVILLDEQFIGGTGPTNTTTATWSQTDPASFEVYSNGGFAVRGITGGTTPADPLGGLEVLSQATSNTVTISILLPANLDDAVDGQFFFDAGQRIEGGSGGFAGTLEIVNTTDGRTIQAATAVNKPNFTMAANLVPIDFVASDAGDTLELRFFESAGNSARGLQLADMQLTAAVVPEPATVALAGMASLAAVVFARRRCR